MLRWLKKRHAAPGFVALLLLGMGLTASGYQLATSATVDASKVHINPTTGAREYENQPFSGVAIKHHANGHKASEERYKLGRRHGQLRKWFPNGTLAFESHYAAGRREGYTRSWWSNGKRRSEAHYLDDKPNGESWHWYRSGEKFKKSTFRSGVPVGLQQGWRKNGKLFSNYEYRNGRTYGLRNANLCVELEDEEISIGR